MNYSFLKNAEAGTVFQWNGDDVIVAKVIWPGHGPTCKYCMFHTPVQTSLTASCNAPRSTDLERIPCTRSTGDDVRYIPLVKYAKLRIKGEI